MEAPSRRLAADTPIVALENSTQRDIRQLYTAARCEVRKLRHQEEEPCGDYGGH